MKLVLLLGNEGKEYRTTRHNAAWIVNDFTFSDLDWELDSYHKAYIARKDIAGDSVIFAKPITMMNLSGDALRLLMKKFSIHKEDIILVHDDNDIAVGSYKITVGRGAGNHNGVKSVYGVAGSDIVRIRVGIQSPDRLSALRDYVLGSFRAVEIDKIHETAGHYHDMISDIVSLGCTLAMNKWNRL